MATGTRRTASNGRVPDGWRAWGRWGILSKPGLHPKLGLSIGMTTFRLLQEQT
jgi:hypothetical protein